MNIGYLDVFVLKGSVENGEEDCLTINTVYTFAPAMKFVFLFFYLLFGLVLFVIVYLQHFNLLGLIPIFFMVIIYLISRVLIRHTVWNCFSDLLPIFDVKLSKQKELSKPKIN